MNLSSNCAAGLYEDQRMRGRGWWSLRRGIVGIFQWYASLSPVAQVIIALAILALLGGPTILEGLKILSGK